MNAMSENGLYETIITEQQQNSKYNEERKDDCAIVSNDLKNQNEWKIEAPSFIRLFVMRRIMDKYIQANKRKATKNIIIEQLTSVFQDNKKNQLLAINILTELLNDGIKIYMEKCYNEKKHAVIIEEIFKKMILKKFGQEYNQLITYDTNYDDINNGNNFHQNLLFNSNDLMCKILQHLEWGVNFNKDLFKCSLVNSYWLYHVWNINCVYHVDLTQLFKKTLRCKQNEENIYTVSNM